MTAPPLPYNRQNALASGIARDNASHIAGKIVLTTGVTPGGLGATFIQEVAKHGPSLLILAGRTASKLQKTIDELKSHPETADVHTRILLLDLASQAQIRRAAAEVLAYPEPRIDVLVNSAGVMGGPYRTTAEGVELQFGSNYLGHFLFTNLIMPKLRAADRPRVVNVSSGGHEYGGIRFSDVNFGDGAVYDQWAAYGQSKTGNILFSRALAQKLGKGGLRAFSLHPGVNLDTSLSGAGEGGFSEQDVKELTAINEKLRGTKEFDLKTLDECAATHVAAAFDPRIDAYNGAYLEDGNVFPDRQPLPASNLEEAERLWRLSEELVGQTFEY